MMAERNERPLSSQISRCRHGRARAPAASPAAAEAALLLDRHLAAAD